METFPAPPPHAFVPVRPLDAPAPPRAAPPPIAPARPLEMLALVAIVVLADVTLYWGTGGAGLATLLSGIAAVLLVAADVRRFSWRLVGIGVLFAAVVGRTYWEAGVGTTLLGPLLLLAF